MLGEPSKIGIGLLSLPHGARLSRLAVPAGACHWRLHLEVLVLTFVLFPLPVLAVGRLTAPVLSPRLPAGFLFLTLLPSTVQSLIAFTAVGHDNVSAAVRSASLSNVFGLFMTLVFQIQLAVRAVLAQRRAARAATFRGEVAP
ncbi:bile acid:sodium symporter [Bradyrhizobium sp. WU425]|uniref:bile acid:sodium symporter n=1 Tax=Bradyrhizobium sp. WU425 TaxID=187029 RepID=UPI001E564F43|nr:bile acid:sodium symporter [Bradyrhizobium canariense]UFW71365.1 bile acid:sodium symporter [Bradyrhizobium canariense]